MRWLKLTVIGLALGVACGAAATELWPVHEAGEPLYFALQVTRQGHVVARPQLIGESGKDLRAVLHDRAGTPLLALSLHPTLHGSRCGVDLQVDLPQERGLEQTFDLRSGQQMRARLSHDVSVELLAMRVRSPEFEAYMQNAPVDETPADF